MKIRIVLAIVMVALISGVFAQSQFAQEHSRKDFIIEKAVHDSVQKWIRDGRFNPADGATLTGYRLRITMQDSIRTVIRDNFTENQSRDSNVPTPYDAAISGRVFESDGTTPISGVPVRVYNTSWQQAGWIETNGSGYFIVGNLQGGNYYVYAEGYLYTLGDVYFPEYYDNSATQGGATQVSVADSDTTDGINMTLDRKASISGRVCQSDGTTPIANTMIDVYNSAWESVTGAFTNGSGYFTVYGLLGGAYYLKATGYIVGEGEFYIEEYYDDSATQGGASSVPVYPPSAEDGINFNLTRGYHVWAYVVEGVGHVTTNPQKLVYPPGDVVELYAYPSELYPQFTFDHWGGDISGTMNPISVTCEGEDYEIQADVYFREITGPQYYLNTFANPYEAGVINRDPDQTMYDSAAVVQITAVPEAGWVFREWSTDFSGTDNPATVVMNFDKYISGNFGHSLDITVTPVGTGTVTPYPDKDVYDHEEMVQLMATPADGYQFKRWDGDYDGTDNPAYLSMHTNKYIYAVFETIPSNDVILTMQVYPEGTGETVPAVGDHTYESYTDVEITAEPIDGYRFIYWEGGSIAEPCSAHTTVMMNVSKTVTAKFEPISPPGYATLTMQVYPEGTGVTAPVIGNHIYPLNTVVEIAAEPVDGYQFKYWIGGGIDNIYAAHTTVIVDENRTVKAKFEPIPPEYVTLTMQVYPENAGETVPIVGNHTYPTNTVVEISAEPMDGYQFKYWTGGGIDNIYSAHTTVTMNENRTIKAKFEEIPTNEVTLTMQVNPDSVGETCPEVGTHTYAEGEVVQVIASTPDGYQFVGWEGPVADWENDTTTVTMHSDKTVIAFFETLMDDSVSLTMQVEPVGSGFTEPEIGTHTFEVGQVVEIAAEPADGFLFQYWKGGVPDSTAIETSVTLEEDMVVTAFFSSFDTLPPILKNCLPIPGSQCIPQNSKIQFSLKDQENGVDKYNLNVWVDGSLIIENGVDQTGGHTLVTAHFEAKRVKYFPPEPFDAEATVTVRVQAPDLANPANVLDSTYVFTTIGVTIDTSDATIICQQGGVVIDSTTGIEMEIPAEALDDTVEITITPVEDIPPLPEGLQGLATPAHFGPDGLQFLIPISVRIPYTQADLDSAGIDSPEELHIYYYHTSTGEWVELTITFVDTEGMYIYVTVDQFCYLTFGQGSNTDVEDPAQPIQAPAHFMLSQNYPNPFNPETQITYEVGEACHVLLSVFDTNGRLIKPLVNSETSSGKYTILWDATNLSGDKVPSGLYLLVMKAGEYHHVRKMSLLK